MHITTGLSNFRYSAWTILSKQPRVYKRVMELSLGVLVLNSHIHNKDTYRERNMFDIPAEIRVVVCNSGRTAQRRARV